jgi:hypothetical protein
MDTVIVMHLRGCFLVVGHGVLGKRIKNER